MSSDFSSFLSSLGASSSSSEVQLLSVLTSIVVCLSLSLSLAFVYEKTHAGATYSRSFVQTVILASLVSTIMIFAIGNNVARGLGIMGALTIIRFRTPIRDPRDMIFIFASLALGVSCGSQLYGLASVGAVAFVLTTFVLDISPYSARKRFDGLLRLFVNSSSNAVDDIMDTIRANTKSYEVVAVRDVNNGDILEYAIEVHLLRSNLYNRIIEELSAIDGVSEVNLVMQRDSVEI